MILRATKDIRRFLYAVIPVLLNNCSINNYLQVNPRFAAEVNGTLRAKIFDNTWVTFITLNFTPWVRVSHTGTVTFSAS